jgi:uncharacterized integral membrane protein
MKNLALLLIALLMAWWIGAIALIAVQNAEPVTLTFLTYQSIALPFGLVLAFSVGLGVIGSAVLLPILGVFGGGSPGDEAEE